MHEWVLIAFLGTYSAGGSVAVTFPSQSVCVAAAENLRAASRSVVLTVCVSNNTGDVFLPEK